MTENVKFERLDGPLHQEAERLVEMLKGTDSPTVSVKLDRQLAALIRQFLSTALEGGVAYGPWAAELSPEQAAKILGISRPLVVRRMQDGRLPFHYVGTHRRCKFADVLRLKAAEASQDRLMEEIYDDFEEIGDFEDSPVS